jgi:hypothetical protein
MDMDEKRQSRDLKSFETKFGFSQNSFFGSLSEAASNLRKCIVQKMKAHFGFHLFMADFKTKVKDPTTAFRSISNQNVKKKHCYAM